MKKTWLFAIALPVIIAGCSNRHLEPTFDKFKQQNTNICDIGEVNFDQSKFRSVERSVFFGLKKVTSNKKPPAFFLNVHIEYGTTPDDDKNIKFIPHQSLVLLIDGEPVSLDVDENSLKSYLGSGIMLHHRILIADFPIKDTRILEKMKTAKFIEYKIYTTSHFFEIEGNLTPENIANLKNCLRPS